MSKKDKQRRLNTVSSSSKTSRSVKENQCNNRRSGIQQNLMTLNRQVSHAELMVSTFQRLLVHELGIVTEDQIQKTFDFERTRAIKYDQMWRNPEQSIEDKLAVCEQWDIPVKLTPIPQQVMIDKEMTQEEKEALAEKYDFSLDDTTPIPDEEKDEGNE